MFLQLVAAAIRRHRLAYKVEGSKRKFYSFLPVAVSVEGHKLLIFGAIGLGRYQPRLVITGDNSYKMNPR